MEIPPLSRRDSLRLLLCDAACPPRRHAGSFAAVVVAAHEVAKRDAERCCQRRQDALVVGFAGLEALDRAREYAGCRGEIVDAVATCDAKAQDACRQQFDRGVFGVVRSTASDTVVAKCSPSSLRLGAPVGGLDRVADRRAQADTGEDHV